MILLLFFKLSKPKGFMNLDVKLGGLGPDYVTAKEKVSIKKALLLFHMSHSHAY